MNLKCDATRDKVKYRNSASSFEMNVDGCPIEEQNRYNKT